MAPRVNSFSGNRCERGAAAADENQRQALGQLPISGRPDMKVVKILDPIAVVSAVTGERQQRHVAILLRDDGHFSFAEEYFYTSIWEGEIKAQGWARLPPEGIFESAEIAEAEGRLRFLQRHEVA
jgi:hypothetical protein